MDDFVLYGCDEKELKEKLEIFLLFAQEKYLKLMPNKYVIGTEDELGGSVLTVEKVKIEELIFIQPLKEKE